MSYFFYYAIFLIAQSVFTVTSALALNLRWECTPFEKYLQIGPLAVQYLLFLLMIVVNLSTLHLLDDIAPKEKIGFFKNIYHWIAAPFVMIAYALIAFYALTEVVFRGKRVCKHGASKKNEIL